MFITFLGGMEYRPSDKEHSTRLFGTDPHSDLDPGSIDADFVWAIGAIASTRKKSSFAPHHSIITPHSTSQELRQLFNKTLARGANATETGGRPDPLVRYQRSHTSYSRIYGGGSPGRKVHGKGMKGEG